MSYILDALRKSENERKAKEQSAKLQTPDSQEIPPQNTKIVLLIIILICINILVLIYFVFFNTQTSTNTISEIEPQTVDVEPPKIIAQHPSTVIKKLKPNKTGAIKKESPPPAMNLTSVEPSQQVSISDMLEQQSIAKKPVLTSSNKKNEALAAPIKKQTKKLVKFTAVKQTAQKTESKPKNRPQPIKKAETIPFLKEMPPEFRRRVPNLNVNVFVYAEEPENRFVIIDMKKYRADEETETGVKIKTIKKESLILEYNNRSFQIKRP